MPISENVGDEPYKVANGVKHTSDEEKELIEVPVHLLCFLLQSKCIFFLHANSNINPLTADTRIRV